MEEVVGGLLRDRGLTISAAESCTGGLLMTRLTDVPGSSGYVLGGAVTYSNELKTILADVPPLVIDAHGAVSEPVAVALADGIRARTGASFGVGITGIAGPGGATPDKPVGTVAIALTGERPSGASAHVLLHRRPSAGAVPGNSGGARYGQKDVLQAFRSELCGAAA